ncbi:hypothetical protein BO94DRAFT_597312 [Aspergillus sclerotioniger CBS 115572]|uniref:ubiquitinyl hydrolase 1 n=1 Tax=Aspergillus sclerotioniger CBS 115572 TaxID=1450535 RepID=A0A317WJS4_9EURO|nr:hypothetical protein BO94DRAFT_597312 [Aspergillus sclerotioniger CBS 115572]PWY86579.1 hypothetical protein BO94DRAFT_597312 [Aspergillus sclerotioniger CBS 115572]
MSTEALKYCFYHIIHPPMLPQGVTDQEWHLEKRLHQMIQEVLKEFIENISSDSQDSWAIVARMSENWMETEKKSTPCKESLTRIISDLRSLGATALYVRAQNCGWVAYYDHNHDMLICDAFEAAPCAECVISAQGSWLRQFPGQSIAIPADRLDDAKFCSWLAGEVSQLSTETVNEMVPMSKKAGAQVSEERDTTHPGLITEGLMIQLLAFGRHNNWPSFDKHMHDEVNWRDSRLPWRRSPYWFVAKVALQIVLRRVFGDIEGHRHYKNFMLYIVAHIALKANDMPRETFSADQLQVIRAKMARRIQKLDGKVHDYVARRVLSAESAIRRNLEDIQEKIKQANSTFVFEIFRCTQQDLQLTLDSSSAYLQAAFSQSHTQAETSQFNRPGNTRNQYDMYGLPRLRSNDLLSVLDFERWVEHDMDHWDGANFSSVDVVCAIKDRFNQYDAHGTRFMAGNPEAMSIMRLTQLELWVTLDRICAKICPLLRKYSPEIPVDFLEPLLLPQRCQMRRANKIEAYIKERQQDQVHGSIFCDPHSRGFVVAYYILFDGFNELRQRIEEYVQDMVEKKRREWVSKSKQYISLQHKSSQVQHTHALSQRGYPFHRSYCEKCSYDIQSACMAIEIYEWPLPEKESLLKTVIFELQCPRWFAAWRDVTWTIVQDFGRRRLKPASQMELNLLKYDETRQFTESWSQRLTLGSTTKSWKHTHYRKRSFPVDLKQNQVLADQTKYDSSLNLHEFVAFGGLRAGERVQWLNILRELASPALSLNEESVGILIRQAAWELGTSSHSTDLREAHWIFEDVAFTSRLLEILERRLDFIEANWTEHHTLHSLIVIGLRALSLSDTDAVVERTAAFIRRGRRIAMRWTENLTTTLDSQTRTQSQAKQQLLTRVGRICQLTYAVESHHVPALLCSPDDLFHLTRASVVVFQNTPAKIRETMSAKNASWIQTSRILHHVEAQTRQLIQQEAGGLNKMLRKSASDLVITDDWSFDHGGLTRWAINQVPSDGVRRQQEIRYDLLSGELLVDNTPPGRLPDNYRNDPSFNRLFGLRIFAVLPSSLVGSRYMSAQHFREYQVHFGMEEDGLVIKAQQGSQVFRYIPPNRLQGDFPEALLMNYAHWLSLHDGKLEFRLIAQAWQPTASNWCLSMNFSVMVRPRCTMVDIRSRLYRRLSRVLTALDKSDYMVVYQTPEDVEVVEMVRLRLRFLVTRDGPLESPELNATVDRDQDIGSFYGLKNKLVLRDINEPEHRSVLIPYGNAHPAKQGGHPIVRMELRQGTYIRYFRYLLDPHLQEFRGPGDMLGILYQAYMHALTGFVLADPATHRLGTAEALRILRQARLRSSLPLEKECLELLERLAALTPRRQYYPRHLRSMQSIEWNRDLGELAQHDDFQVLVQAIMGHARSFSMLYEVTASDQTVRMYPDRGIPIYSKGPVCVMQNSILPSLGVPHKSSRSARVYEVAALIRDWPTSVPQCSKLYSTVAGWERVQLSALAVCDLGCQDRLDLSFRNAWGALYEPCRLSDRRRDSYNLMSLFCTVAFRGDEEMANLRPLLVVAFSEKFSDLPVPDFGEAGTALHLQRGADLIPSQIANEIESRYPSFDIAPNFTWLSTKQQKTILAEQERYEATRRSRIHHCQTVISEQWPCERPRVPRIPEEYHTQASEACAALCTGWYRNRIFLRFLRAVQQRLDALAPDPAGPVDCNLPPDPAPVPPRSARVGFRPPSLMDLLIASASRVPAAAAALPSSLPPLTFRRPHAPHCYSTDTSSELRYLVSALCNDSHPYRRRVGEGLQKSLEALETRQWPCSLTSLPVPRGVLARHCGKIQQQRDSLWSTVYRMLAATNGASDVVTSAVMWPPINVHSILSVLVADQWPLVPESWKHLLLTFAQSITSLRRSKRLLACYDRNDVEGFFKEAEAAGCDGWDARTRPEWLLLEIENNITIRARQARVAQRMICPDPPGNSVLQLNMGEGKTTVITPMVALSLTSGCRVPQIIVLKPLLRQSLDLLSQRLGGILGRPIYHIPFSRSTVLDDQKLEVLGDIYQQCQEHRGVLLTLPEHILSFRLVGLDLIDRNPTLAPKAIQLEVWLQEHCHKIIDESDEILDPKFQLVYTVGCQQSLDGHSDRWQITQGLLSLVEQQAEELYTQDPNSLDMEHHGARYPILHFLKANTVKNLIESILRAIQGQGLPGLPLHLRCRRVRTCALDFIRLTRPQPREVQALHEAFEGGSSLHKLLVLRGLLAYVILRFTLAGKRWLVDYGLHPERCMMAVPFRAKGVLSENAEFGHPDVAITLTCLSYYYHGLSPDQILHCFAILGKENDPGAEYQHWIQREISTLPEELRVLTGVNLKDGRTFKQILYPHLQYQKGLVDFYLSHVVFPKEAKEYPHKLSTSAWDLPSRPNQPPTTGFSGTNDNRFLLPRSVPQRDLLQLLHTNAMTLSLLLRPENRQCIFAQDAEGRPLRADQLLDLISQPVEVEAAIFFSEQDEVVVIDRESHIERLASSGFRQQVGKCLVFLDQQHCRGVVLKLPSSYRAAVTLGPRLAKDRLVQACNRMRELGNGQSVMFLIPPEVRHSLTLQTTPITSLNVIQWTLTQACDIFQSIGPLWAIQGLQYYRRQREWDRLVGEEISPQEALQLIQEPEARTLSQLYAPWDNHELSPVGQMSDMDDPIIQELLQEWQGSDRGMRKGAQLHEEQERQIRHEVQREKQVYRPPGFNPAPHRVHGDIRYIVAHGQLPRSCSSAVQTAFDIFRQTSAGRFEFPSGLAPNLFVSEDFVRTVQRSTKGQNDEFLKPAHWVLSNVYNQELFLLSQFEVNELLPDIPASEKTRLHIYTPRTTMTMRSFEALDFYSIGYGQPSVRPPQATIQDLGLFAGTLYFDTFTIYEGLRQFLGLLTDEYRDIPSNRVTNEGFVDAETREAHDWPVESPFQNIVTI